MLGINSLHQQQHAHADQGGCDPAAAVDIFMKKELCQHRGTDKRKRSGGRRHQAGVAPGKRGEQAEKAEDEAA